MFMKPFVIITSMEVFFMFQVLRVVFEATDIGIGLGPDLIMSAMYGRALPFFVMPSSPKFFPEADQIGEKDWQGRE